jgi:hypothetical protein
VGDFVQAAGEAEIRNNTKFLNDINKLPKEAESILWKEHHILN